MKLLNLNKRILYCTYVLMIALLFSGCSKDKSLGLSSESKNEETKTYLEETNSQNGNEIMDFNKTLQLKKPKKPISKSPSILFLGNSFLFVNDLPSMFTKLSESGGISPNIYDLSEGCYRLELFADKKDEVGSIAYDALENYQWDYVVLQEQSRIPTVDAENSMYPASRKLNKLIKDGNGQTIFFMTWAYKNGDDLSEFGINQKTTREEMQTQIANSYFSISKELDSLLSPAGIAFMRCAEKYPEINLWDEEDLMHPSVYGTYLASCTLYATLYDESPVGLKYTADLDSDTALKLQKIAYDTIFN
ncbi:DUF4886 domain-containing protein [Clostridium weizhouense]|uniref:DUF4886 domain-containing protein n=1 Tax=Clostridium weizhouense TaxID=2859781 RepID=A0ABS7AN76_9CLOT|nr:DUF4886 domain-containing protein [Clostridium weizhouense]MBW6410099.1 DUF4886 domain-containing protein [Clostridium weizhouense]